MAGYCKHGDEPRGSLKYLRCLSVHLSPKRVSAPYSWGPHYCSLLSLSPVDTEGNIDVVRELYCGITDVLSVHTDALISAMNKHSEITGTLCMATIEFSSGVGFEFLR